VLELVVYGASGFGQQVMFWVEEANAADPRFTLLGFIDDDPSTHGDTRTDRRVLGDAEWLRRYAAERPVAVVLGLAEPRIKERIVAGLDGLPVEFPTIVHPSTVVSRHASLAPGVVVGPANVVGVNVGVGAFTTVVTACTFGHDVRVGRYATLLPGVNVSGRVVVGEAATIGTGTAIIQGVEIGADATVGAGATVVDDLPPGCLAVGTPARPRAPGR
jgi:sugar O-acyltransferase (sialic acid O-acetyltransferase NeuD family)